MGGKRSKRLPQGLARDLLSKCSPLGSGPFLVLPGRLAGVWSGNPSRWSPGEVRVAEAAGDGVEPT